MDFREISHEEWACRPMHLIGKEGMLLTVGAFPDGATGKPSYNAMTVGWGGFGVMWGVPTVFFAVRPSRHTFSFIETGNSVSLSAFLPEFREALRFCGTHSGRDTDKITACGLHPIPLPGGVGYREASLVITAKKCAAVSLDAEALGEKLCKTYYPTGDFHRFYFAAVDRIYCKE